MDENNNLESPSQKSVIDIILREISLLWRDRVLIVTITLIGTILVFGFALASKLLPPDLSPLPNKYTAEAILLIDTGSSSSSLTSLLSNYGMGIGLGESSSKNNVNMINIILNSNSFLDRIVEEFDIINKYNITEYPKTISRTIVETGTKSNFNASSNTLSLSYSSTNPEYAAEFVNRQVELLQDWYTEFGGHMSEKDLRLLEFQLASQESQIASLEEDIKNFQQEYNTLSIEDLAALQASMIADLRAQVTQINIQISSYQQFSVAEIENESLISLRNQRANLNYLISQLEQGYSNGEKIMPSIEELPDLGIEYAKLKQELEVQYSIYQKLREQLELTKINSHRNELFTVLEYAEVPEIKESPRRSVIVVTGAFLSCLVGIVIALMRRHSHIILAQIQERIIKAQR